MSFKALGESRTIGDARIQYLRDSSHGHEGGHQIALTRKTVTVLPDGRTTSTNRSHVITRVLHTIPADHPLAVEALIGALVLEGATNIEIDGQKILTDQTEITVASLRLDVVQTGDQIDLRVISMGGA